jgi:hypothetical protein
MGTSESQRRTVLVPQALGADEFLRVTWHEGRRVIVFSHWDGERCVAATPIRVSDIAELAELVVSAMAHGWADGWAEGRAHGWADGRADGRAEAASPDRAADWPAPHPCDRRPDPLTRPA